MRKFFTFQSLAFVGLWLVSMDAKAHFNPFAQQVFEPMASSFYDFSSHKCSEDVSMLALSSTGTVLAKQSFETSGDTWAYSLTPNSYDISNDVWAERGSLSSISPQEGAQFWGMSDLNNGNGGGDFDHIIEFTAQDLTGFNSVELSFQYYTIGFDAGNGDELSYVVEFDNQSTWAANTTLNPNTGTWTEVQISVPDTANYVRLRLVGNQNGGTDYAGFDNVVLSGTSAVPSCDTDTTFVYSDCDSVLFEGAYYTSSTTVVDTLTNSQSCDSLIYNQLIVNQSYNQTLDTVYALESIVLNGIEYTSSQTVDSTFQTIHACDSLLSIPIHVESYNGIGSLLLSQSFEMANTGWNFTHFPNQYNISGDVWMPVNNLASISGATLGNKFWGGQDIDNNNGGGAFAHTLTFDAVDISAHTEVALVYDYYVNIAGGASDYVSIYVEFDSLNTWTDTATHVQNNQTGMWLTDTILVPDTANFIRLQLVADFNGGSDYFGFDNIKLLSNFTSVDCTSNTDSVDYAQSTCLDSLVINNQTFTTTGLYTQTLTNVSNCDSVVNLDLTFNTEALTTLSEHICDGESFSVGSSTYTISGTYSDTLTAQNTCDSIVNLTLDVGQVSPNGSQTIVTCDDSIMLNNDTITTSGTYFYYLTNSSGCDSLMIYNITLSNTLQEYQVIETCQDTLEINGEYYTSSGLYTQNFSTAEGCDSVLSLSISFAAPITSNYTTSSCSGSLTVNGETFVSSGNYTQVLQTPGGCDSTISLSLTIGLASDTVYVSDTICASQTYDWNGSSYDVTGLYNQTFSNATNCDSVVQLDLLVNTLNVMSIDTSICEETTFTFGNLTTSSSGVYQVELDNFDETCTSYELTVQFVDLDVPSLSLVDKTIVANPNTGDFQWYDCATDMPISGETNSFFAPSQDGEYYAVLSQYGCEVTTDCIEVQGIGLDDLEPLFAVYPNPNLGQFSIQILNDFKHDEFVIHSALGQEIYRFDAGMEQQIELELDLAPGVYYLMSNYEGKANGITRLVIQN
ncbi:MAG: hypothetical protein ACPGEC_00425 [Flavobacteriales bacterium]